MGLTAQSSLTVVATCRWSDHVPSLFPRFIVPIHPRCFEAMVHGRVKSMVLDGCPIDCLDKLGRIPVQPPGAGTLQDPVRIENLAHLRWLGETERPEDMVKTYLIVNDIDASEIVNWSNSVVAAGFLGIGGFEPVDNTGIVRPLQFTGRILGNGKTISNLYIAPVPGNNVGFVRIIGAGGRVENLTLDNLHVRGSHHLGGIAGINQGIIVSSSAEVRFTTTVSKQRRIGGLVGSFTESRSIVERGYSATTMTTAGLENQTPGGIAGSVGTQDPNAVGGQIRHSYFVGSFAPEGSKLPSFNNYSIDANTLNQKDLRSLTGPVGMDADWAINSPSGEWAMLSVDQIQANGKFYRAYPYLKIFNYDEPGTTPAVLPLPGLIEMPMPPQIDRDNTSVNSGTLTLAFSVPQNSVDATVTGMEYSLDNGQTWQTASQALSPISVTGLQDNQAYIVRVRTQTNQGAGPMSQPYRVITGGTIFQDRFQQIPNP